MYVSASATVPLKSMPRKQSETIRISPEEKEVEGDAKYCTPEAEIIAKLAQHSKSQKASCSLPPEYGLSHQYFPNAEPNEPHYQKRKYFSSSSFKQTSPSKSSPINIRSSSATNQVVTFPRSAIYSIAEEKTHASFVTFGERNQYEKEDDKNSAGDSPMFFSSHVKDGSHEVTMRMHQPRHYNHLPKNVSA